MTKTIRRIFHFGAVFFLACGIACADPVSPGSGEGEGGVMPASGGTFQGSLTLDVNLESKSSDSSGGGEPQEGGGGTQIIRVTDPENSRYKITIATGEHHLFVLLEIGKGQEGRVMYSLNLETGELTIIRPSRPHQPGKKKVSPSDPEPYLAALREVQGVVNSAFTLAPAGQKPQIQPVLDYLSRVIAAFVSPVPVSGSWQARTAPETWNDARAVSSVSYDPVTNELVLHSSFDANRQFYGKGEVYIYVSDVAGLGTQELDASDKKLVMEVFIPAGFVTDPSNPEHLRLFLKSGDNWEPVYGIWRKLDYSEEGTWVTLEFSPTGDPASWKDAGFDPQRVWEFGIAFNKGTGQYAGDGLRIRNVRFERVERTTLPEPVARPTPPLPVEVFLRFSGRNLNFSEYNYGWSVGEFPVIWGEGDDGGFSTPAGKEKLREALLRMKASGISTIRIMALFGDLRTGIRQDAEGNFIFDWAGNLQFDAKVYADVKAFFEVLHETGMKAVVGLFDFRIADAIDREGTRDASFLVGEHPEILTDPKVQDAFVRLFRRFFERIYSPGFVNFNLANVILFWEVMNEPEAVCAADFDQVLSFHDRFFDMIKRYGRGELVTTSSLSIDSAFRFWRDKVDVISVHHYPDIESLTISDPVGNYGFGRKPVFWTEFGDRNLTVSSVLDQAHDSGVNGLLFWEDSYYTFSQDEYAAWVRAHIP